MCARQQKTPPDLSQQSLALPLRVSLASVVLRRSSAVGPSAGQIESDCEANAATLEVWLDVGQTRQEKLISILTHAERGVSEARLGQAGGGWGRLEQGASQDL